MITAELINHFGAHVPWEKGKTKVVHLDSEKLSESVHNRSIYTHALHNHYRCLWSENIQYNRGTKPPFDNVIRWSLLITWIRIVVQRSPFGLFAKHQDKSHNSYCHDRQRLHRGDDEARLGTSHHDGKEIKLTLSHRH